MNNNNTNALLNAMAEAVALLIFRDNRRSRMLALFIIMILLPAISGRMATASAVPMDNSHKVEKLSFAERMSFRTNATDWLLMVPNIGMEYDVRSENWNRWAVNLNLRYRPGAKTTYLLPLVYEMSEIKLEGRMYWHERQARPAGYLKRHTQIWDKLMSCRRMVVKHPKTVFYRGVYASYGNYDVRLTDDGHRGKAVQAGITWGFMRPLYTYRNGNSIDLEVGISGGLALAKDETYVFKRKDNEYQSKEQKGWKLVNMPVVNDLHVALVYRLGNYPFQKKYRWRYDVDMDFRALKDSLWLRDNSDGIEKHYRDSVYKVVANDFRVMYDSIVAVKKQERQAKIDSKAPARIERPAKKGGKK